MSGETFGQLLRVHRERSRLSQNALARAVGVDPAHINRLENGKQFRPGRDVTLAIAEATGLGADETDRLLYAAGLAPETDWQEMYRELEAAIRTVRSAANTIAGATATVRMTRHIG